MFGKKKSEGSHDDEVQFFGVTRKSGKYLARIRGLEEKGKRTTLGTFKTAEEAALAYDFAARSKGGFNVCTNFVYPDTKEGCSHTNITAPEEPEYQLSPDHPAAAAGYNHDGAGYNYDAAGYNYAGSGYNYDAGGYNAGYQQSYFGPREGQFSGSQMTDGAWANSGFGQVDYPQNSGFGQVEYPQWVPGDELPPLPQDLTSSAVGYGGEYFGVEPPPGSSYSSGGGYGW